MGFWKRLFGRDRSRELKPQRLDYLNEGLALERQGGYEGAPTAHPVGAGGRPPAPPGLPGAPAARVGRPEVGRARQPVVDRAGRTRRPVRRAAALALLAA